MQGVDEAGDFAGECDDVGGEGEAGEVELGLLLLDCVGRGLLFMSSRRMFMTLVRTMKSGWLW